MFLKVRDVMNIMEDYAPVRFKESYDNVGLMVGETECEITNILVALDCTLKVIEEAKENGCNLILTHHPILFLKPITITNETLLGKKLLELIKNNINVYSSHTNLDSVVGGVNDIILEVLGLNAGVTIDKIEGTTGKYENSGIGRLVELKEAVTLKDLCDSVKEKLNTPSVRYAGNLQKEIKKVAVINGAGQSYFNAAKAMGADCIITGDTSYHFVSDISEEGIAVIDAGHFDTEWPAIKIFAEKFKEKVEKLGYENTVIVSKSVENPYKYI